MDREAIKKILPHREPMLLLDEAELVGHISVGQYTVRGDEFFLQGHFPGNPIVPGVILCEMMGQSACMLFEMDGDAKYATYFTGFNNVKFRQKVLPGDTVILKSELVKRKDEHYKIKSAGYVNDKLCVAGELSFAIMKEQ
jgi:3-hydroxyacyl-[acyl-carrier-protein] dehydratase